MEQIRIESDLERPRTALVRAPYEEVEDRLHADIARIVALEDGALRNLLITQRYHDLSHGMAGVLGRENVNWSTFATWASKTAGESIRGEVVPRSLRVLLAQEQAFERALGRLRYKLLGGRPGPVTETLFDIARDALLRVQRQVAEGNLRVFAELAPKFASFQATFTGLREPSEALYADFERRMAFRPGLPSVADGQDLLKSAFRTYYECTFEPSVTLKAEKMLLANAQIGLHEQTRLQPNIQGALDAPIREVVENQAIRRLPKFLPTSVRGPFENVARTIARPVVKLTTRIWEHVATETMMTLGLPGGRLLPLGRDVPVAAAGFPAPLRQISYAPLQDLLNQYDHSQNSTRGSGAEDWAELNQRMHFIIDLFRVSQLDQTLYDSPFTATQREAFEALRLPQGPL